MSVTPETHQPAMAPYFAVAAAASESYSLAAAFRSALLVKVWPVQAGGEGEGGGVEGDNGMHTPQATAQMFWIWPHPSNVFTSSQLGSWS